MIPIFCKFLAQPFARHSVFGDDGGHINLDHSYFVLFVSWNYYTKFSFICLSRLRFCLPLFALRQIPGGAQAWFHCAISSSRCTNSSASATEQGLTCARKLIRRAMNATRVVRMCNDRRFQGFNNYLRNKQKQWKIEMK